MHYHHDFALKKCNVEKERKNGGVVQKNAAALFFSHHLLNTHFRQGRLNFKKSGEYQRKRIFM